MRTWLRSSSVLLVPVAFTATFGLLTLDDRPLWRDEVMSARLSTLPAGELARTLWEDEPNMAPYYATLRLWAAIGTSDQWLRALSLVGAVVAVGWFTHLAIGWLGRRWGLVAGATLAAHPMVTDYAVEARSYSWALVAGLGATHALGFGDRPLRPLAYGIAVALLVALDPVGLLLVPAHAAALAWARVDVATWRRWAGGVAVAAVAAAPFVVADLGKDRDHLAWIDPLTPASFVREAGSMVGMPLFAAVAAVGGVVALVAWRAARVDLERALVVSSVIVPVAGLVLASLVIRPLFVDRYLIFVVPFVVLAAVAGAQIVAARTNLGLVAAVALVLAALVSDGSPLTAGMRIEDGRAAATELDALVDRGDRVLSAPISASWVVERYLDRGIDDLVGRPVAGGTTWLITYDWYEPEADRPSGAAVAALRGRTPRSTRCHGELCIEEYR